MSERRCGARYQVRRLEMTRNRIAQLAQKYMYHDMIGKHTELPDFPEARIRLLYSVLGHQPAASLNKELMALVASLVQMGLDTHDTVRNENAPSGEKSGILSMRAQQLKVLAGDFFSARFYQLLSQAGQIDAVRRMSEAVCEVNRVKMIFYTKMKQLKLNAEEYVQLSSEIRSGLFVAFTAFMQGLCERLWPEIVERFSRCEVLLKEIRQVEQTSDLESSWGVWHIMQEGSEEDRLALAQRQEDSSFIRHLLDKYHVPRSSAGC
ncbi:heptaprenyl diphosphate synthase [Cohnella faecalis]|uniref:Heptaprenyl diphosphate synthase n=2 Tax=Cohnella faecalis TaxID=2315694 RepID=A0A398CQ41_9BACL|nr:heptaprenyl diphosphate synthase [Cohnella faecalis]